MLGASLELTAFSFFSSLRPQHWCSWLENSPRMRNVGCSNPYCDRPVIKTGSLLNVWQQLWLTWVLGDVPCHSRCVPLKNHHCSTAMNSEHMCIYKPFVMLEKFSRGTENKTSKPTNKTNVSYPRCIAFFHFSFDQVYCILTIL